MGEPNVDNFVEFHNLGNIPLFTLLGYLTMPVTLMKLQESGRRSIVNNVMLYQSLSIKPNK